jgi:hypothetical protein
MFLYETKPGIKPGFNAVRTYGRLDLAPKVGEYMKPIIDGKPVDSLGVYNPSFNKRGFASKLLFGADSDSDSLSPGPTDKDKFFVTNDNPGSDKGNYISSIQKSNRRIAHEEKHKNIEKEKHKNIEKEIHQNIEKEIHQNFIILSDIDNSIQKYEYIPKTSISLFSKTLGKNLDLLQKYKGKNLEILKSKHNSFNTEYKNFRKNHTSYWRKNEPSKNITRKQMKSQ